MLQDNEPSQSQTVTTYLRQALYLAELLPHKI
jgi:hypothetical protein